VEHLRDEIAARESTVAHDSPSPARIGPSNGSDRRSRRPDSSAK
jgi:hypothetical protein